MVVKLSIIIVNYNVRYFLEQCLLSVRKAITDIPSEVTVVDNQSVDGSAAMVREKFPWVQLIVNTSNLGYSAANNMALRKVQGEYVVLLNPDTLVQEDTFRKCIAFMECHPDSGAMGVKMIDGKGRFLPESKRSLPTPAVAFFKIFGFSSLFPASRLFGRYYLGHLDPDAVHKVEILTGAFMFMRRSALEAVGLLDEDFFMYGEDIDLSYRLIKAGYTNYYYPGTTIIHYKGASTRKSSVNYVILFYRAMIIFSRKHFARGRTGIFYLLIHLAIYFRAMISIVRRFINRMYLPLIDAAVIGLGFIIIKPVWERIKLEGGSYPPEYLLLLVPASIFIWLTAIYFYGGYDRPRRPGALVRGIITGSIVILVVYSLLPEHLRYSRAIILLGTAWTFIFTHLIRVVLHLLPFTGYKISPSKNRRILIVGSKAEADRVFTLLLRSGADARLSGLVSPSAVETGDAFLGTIADLDEIIRVNHADEIIFCSASLSAHTIIKKMNDCAHLGVDFKIAPPDSQTVIGTHDIHSPENLYLIRFSTISEPRNRRNKRALDLMLSLLTLLAWPFIFFLFRKPGRLFINMIHVFAGRKSMVGYIPTDKQQSNELPAIRPGVLNPLDITGGLTTEEFISRANLAYARDYKSLNDLIIVIKAFRKLDRI